MTNDKNETDKLAEGQGNSISLRDFGSVQFEVCEIPNPDGSISYSVMAWGPRRQLAGPVRIRARICWIFVRYLATLDMLLPDIAEKYQTLSQEEFQAYLDELKVRRPELFWTEENNT